MTYLGQKFYFSPHIFIATDCVVTQVEECCPKVVSQGGGYSYIFMNTFCHFLGVKILNFNIFGGFQKNKYFCGV